MGVGSFLVFGRKMGFHASTGTGIQKIRIGPGFEHDRATRTIGFVDVGLLGMRNIRYQYTGYHADIIGILIF